MAYFVGIDSGGTKTECWLGDERDVLGRATCGTVKLTKVAEEVAWERLRGLLREVAAETGVELGEVARTCVGMAGYSIASAREWMRRRVARAVGGEVAVCGDEEIALDAAFRGGAGILVIAGTGSIVVGRCGDGRRFKAGGWGPAIGDEGSGHWIGAEAVKAVFRALDQSDDVEEKSALADAIRQAWGGESLGEVLGVANARLGADFAALAPAVMLSAEEGDALAQGVLERAGQALGEQVETVWMKMRRAGEREVRVAYTGSVLERIGAVREAMRRRVEGDGLTVMERAVKPLEGAMWRARQGVGCSSAGA
jgi:N-acetylglucosamine kinase-like BadF-type ATPase